MKIFLTNLGKYNEVGEYENIDKLNDIAERIKELDEEKSKVVKALIQKLDYTLYEAIDKVNSGDYMIYNDCERITE